MAHSITTLTAPLIPSHPRSCMLEHQFIVVALLLLYPSAFTLSYLDFHIIPYVFLLLDLTSKVQAPERSFSMGSFLFAGKLKSSSGI